MLKPRRSCTVSLVTPPDLLSMLHIDFLDTPLITGKETRGAPIRDRVCPSVIFEGNGMPGGGQWKTHLL